VDPIISSSQLKYGYSGENRKPNGILAGVLGPARIAIGKAGYRCLVKAGLYIDKCSFLDATTGEMSYDCHSFGLGSDFSPVVTLDQQEL